MNRSIQIHQALHGYKDGHQLLASSVRLPRDLQALTLTMSDLSGPGFRAGYESYLTGYPLDVVGHYCLARTWFAPDQPRPGCVWTHTLIIRFDDLAHLGQMQQLEPLFQRPHLLDTFEQYESPLELSVADLGSGESLSASIDATVSARVLDALYGTGQKVILSCGNAHTYEALVLAVIDQQWPRLKRGFWFCTGSLSLRETRFDLSVSPPELSHPADDAVLFVESGMSQSIPNSEWVKIAVADLVFPQSSELRAFLFQYGSDFRYSRAAFRPLTEIFLLLASSDEEAAPVGEKVLSTLAYFFPEKAEGYRIKKDVLGMDGEFVPAIGGDAEIMRLALTHPGANAIDEKVLDIEVRAEDLARHQSVVALDLAMTALTLDGVNSEKYLSGYFRAMHDAGSFAHMAPPSMVLYALERKPELLANAKVWRRLEEGGVASEAILQLTGDSAPLHAAINAMMEARAWSGLSLAIRRFGVAALQSICNLIQADCSTREVIDYPDEFFALLWSRPELATAMILQGEVPPIPLIMIAAEADPRSHQLRFLGLGPWIFATEERKVFASPFRERAARVFYLTMSLSRLGDFAPLLISRSFPQICVAIQDGSLESTLLRRLEPSLTWSATKPGLTARLVRTIARAYSDEKWPVERFVSTFKDPAIFSLALIELKDLWKGASYIRSIKASRRDKSCPLSPEQVDVLDRT